MSNKLWLGTAAGKGFATRATANKFMIQRKLLGGQPTQGPDGRWFIDMTGQHIPKEYASRVIGSPEAIEKASRGKPWEDNDNDPATEDSVDTFIDEAAAEVVARERKVTQDAVSAPKRTKKAASTVAPTQEAKRPLEPYAQPDGGLDLDMLYADFDLRTIDSLLSDKELTPEEKAALKEVRAGKLADARFQQIQDTLDNKEAWSLISQQKADDRSYDAHNKNIGKRLNPLEELQQSLRSNMESTAQANFDAVAQRQGEDRRREDNIGLSRWRQQQAEEAKAARDAERQSETISRQENSIGLARWRQGQSEEAKSIRQTEQEEARAGRQESAIGLAMWRERQKQEEAAQKAEVSEQERYDRWFTHPDQEHVMEDLRGRIWGKTKNTNEETVERLITSLRELSDEVDDNTEELKDDKKKGKGGSGGGGKEESLLDRLSAVLGPVVKVLELGGAVVAAASENAKRELLGANATGLSREHYAGLISKAGLGTSIGSQLIGNASNSVINALRNPDSIAGSLEQALTANALLGGPQLDASAIVKAQLSGDTAGLMDVMRQYNKQATPMQIAAVSGVYGQNLSALSEAQGFSQEDTAYRSGLDEQAWRAMERFGLVMSNVLGGDFEEAGNQTKQGVLHVKEAADELTAAMDKVTAGFANILGGGESINSQVQASDKPFNEAVTAAMNEQPLPEAAPQSEEVGDYVLQADGGHLDTSTGMVNYALEAERNQRHLLQATDNQSTQKVEVVANVAVQGHMTTDDGRVIPIKQTGKSVKVSGAGVAK